MQYLSAKSIQNVELQKMYVKILCIPVRIIPRQSCMHWKNILRDYSETAIYLFQVFYRHIYS